MFVKGDIVETTEKSEKLYVYKYPEDKFPGDYKLTTFCSIRPLRGKKTCDFLVPTQYHDRTYVYIQNKVPASKRWTIYDKTFPKNILKASKFINNLAKINHKINI